ncbi:spore protease YyaC [Clostridium tarantellae]|uniref:Spore protease YyaC n=1 Tax=Clostridium tarantellae TaxID=39493 RepID=A0A6I1MLB3_9CLOT|nr:spore protease YyaC [Clostridium tarantellae]MPQ43774.1 spore protease YyaC [Clostridium tarantellae]
MDNSLYIDSLNSKSIFLIRDYLINELSTVIKDNRPIVFFCVGSDRSTGDSLGPLIGEKLKSFSKNNLYIYGTLENPIHAQNILDTLSYIKNTHKKAYIISIDAALGSIDKVGKILIEKKPLHPGLALNKNLPSIGDLSILGFVNISSNLEFMVLQNTRLYTVMNLANTISHGIHHFILKTTGQKKSSCNIDKILEKIL